MIDGLQPAVQHAVKTATNAVSPARISNDVAHRGVGINNRSSQLSCARRYDAAGTLLARRWHVHAAISARRQMTTWRATPPDAPIVGRSAAGGPHVTEIQSALVTADLQKRTARHRSAYLSRVQRASYDAAHYSGALRVDT
jgi:hypothetical protein